MCGLHTRHAMLRTDMRPHIKILADYLVFLVVRIFIAVLQALPLGVCEMLARQFARLMNDVVCMRHAVIDDNLKHAFPEWSIYGIETGRAHSSRTDSVILCGLDSSATPVGSLSRSAAFRILAQRKPIGIVGRRLGY